MRSSLSKSCASGHVEIYHCERECPLCVSKWETWVACENEKGRVGFKALANRLKKQTALNKEHKAEIRGLKTQLSKIDKEIRSCDEAGHDELFRCLNHHLILVLDCFIDDELVHAHECYKVLKEIHSEVKNEIRGQIELSN